MPKHVDQDHTKKQSFGRLPSADESDSEESSGRIVVGKLESHSISAKIYVDSLTPSNKPQLITLATDKGVSKTMLNQLDWEKVKHLCSLVKTPSASGPSVLPATCPFEEKQRSLFVLKKVLPLNHTYVYVVDDKQEPQTGAIPPRGARRHSFGYSQTPPLRSS